MDAWVISTQQRKGGTALFWGFFFFFWNQAWFLPDLGWMRLGWKRWKPDAASSAPLRLPLFVSVPSGSEQHPAGETPLNLSHEVWDTSTPRSSRTCTKWRRDTHRHPPPPAMIMCVVSVPSGLYALYTSTCFPSLIKHLAISCLWINKRVLFPQSLLPPLAPFAVSPLLPSPFSSPSSLAHQSLLAVTFCLWVWLLRFLSYCLNSFWRAVCFVLCALAEGVRLLSLPASSVSAAFPLSPTQTRFESKSSL